MVNIKIRNPLQDKESITRLSFNSENPEFPEIEELRVPLPVEEVEERDEYLPEIVIQLPAKMTTPTELAEFCKEAHTNLYMFLQGYYGF